MKSTNTERARKAATILLDCGSVIFRPKQPFKFASGVLSPIYVDNRLLISFPNQRRKIVQLLGELTKTLSKLDVIAGTSTAGIPHAAWLSDALDVPMIYVRSAPKEHGKGNQIEGIIKRGQKVIVVDDTISTGGSSIEVIKALKAAGAKIVAELAIYTHGLDAAKKAFDEQGVHLVTLTNLETLLEVAKKRGTLTEEKVQMVKSWQKDPKNWGKNMGFE